MTMITPEEPKVALTGRYCTSQAAKALGVHRNTIRNYADAGLLKFKTRRKDGRRFYTGQALLALWRTYYA